MKTTLLFLSLAVASFARPPVEPVSGTPAAPPAEDSVTQETQGSDLLRFLKKYRHDAGNAPEPILFKGDEGILGYQQGDVALWEKYTGQALLPGDLVYYTAVTLKPGQDVIREIASVDPLKTTRNFAVPTNNILGIVRRVVRPTQ